MPAPIPLFSSPAHFQAGFSVLGDPHFCGFDGVAFEFQGEPDKFYNLISLPNFQLNALFSDFPTTPGTTTMHEIGITMVNRHSLFRIKLDAQGNYYINNSVMSLPVDYDVGIFDNAENTPELYNEIAKAVTDGIGTLLKGFTLTYQGLFLFISYETDNVNLPFYNVVGKIDGDLTPHGIIGQTANRERRELIQGGFGDYEVSTLFSNNFRYNLFEREFINGNYSQ